MPRSLAWFALTGLIYLLQLSPIPGVVLMMFAAAWWSVLTINIGFISLGVEAGIGRISKLWLIAPVMWFAGYGAIALLNHTEVAALGRDLAQRNAGQTLAWTPDASSLVLDIMGYGLSGDGMIAAYDLPVVYDANPNVAPARHLAYRIGSQAICDRIREDKALRDASVLSMWPEPIRRLDHGLCEYSLPEDPALPPVTVAATHETIKSAWMPYELDHLRATDAHGLSIELTAAVAAPLSWWPQPIMGCALNDGAAKWQCFAGFGRERAHALGGATPAENTAMGMIAKALGLAPRDAAHNPLADEAQANAAFDAIVARQIAQSLADLKMILADPAGTRRVDRIPGLNNRPDLLSPHAGAMVVALGRALDDRRGRNSAQLLQRLLAALSPEDFNRIGPALLSTLKARVGQEEFADVNRELLARVGELGAPALPLLKQTAFGGRRPHAESLYGPCRIGPAAAGEAERIAQALNTTKRAGSGNEAHLAAYVALLRLGRPDLADRDPDAQVRYQGRNYAELRRTITPASPPSVCVGNFSQIQRPTRPLRRKPVR